MARLQDQLKSSQISFEVQPRVFYEGFPQLVLYVQNVQAAQGAAVWKGVFIADTSTPASPRITLAEEGILVSEGPNRLHLRLSNGSMHEMDPKSTGQLPDLNLRTYRPPDSGAQAENGKEQEPAPVSQLKTTELWRQAHDQNQSHVAVGLDRTSSSLCSADFLPGIGPGRNSAGPVIQEGWEVDWLCSGDLAGVCLLFRVAGGSIAGTAGQEFPRVSECGWPTSCSSWAEHSCCGAQNAGRLTSRHGATG